MSTFSGFLLVYKQLYLNMSCLPVLLVSNFHNAVERGPPTRSAEKRYDIDGMMET